MPSIKNFVEDFVMVLQRHFIWVIIGAYALAAIVPNFGLWIRNVKLDNVSVFSSKVSFSLPLFLLATLLFNAGLGVKIREFTQLLQKPFLLLGSLFGNLATPLTFIFGLSMVLRLWPDSEEVQPILVGLALVAAMPIAGASTAWAQNANGNIALSLGLVLHTTVLSPLLTPMALHVGGFLTTNDYSEDLHELATHGVVTFLSI